MPGREGFVVVVVCLCFCVVVVVVVVLCEIPRICSSNLCSFLQETHPLDLQWKKLHLFFYVGPRRNCTRREAPCEHGEGVGASVQLN